MVTIAPSSYPSPPSSRPHSPSPDAGQDATKDGQIGCSLAGQPPKKDISLSDQLDALLESYLDLLETYTTLRKRLSTDFSSGFFSLAHANRTSTLGPGRRYGEEGYDERMKASILLQIDCKEDQSHKRENTTLDASDLEVAEEYGGHDKHDQADPIKTMHNKQNRNENENMDRLSHGRQAQTDPASFLTQLSSHHAPSQTLTYTINSLPPATEDNFNKDAFSSKTKHLNPLRWYGILIPPHLRQCQARFSTSIISTIPDLVSTISSMKALEEDIRSIRREMGVSNDYAKAELEEPVTI